VNLAAGLLAGGALPIVVVIFQVRTAASGGFKAGTAYNGAIFVEAGPCDVANSDCTALSLQFSAAFP